MNLMDWLVLLAIALAGLYLVIGLGLTFWPEPVSTKKSSPKPRVAVLIAMRNEQHYISQCLSALEKQTYPQHLFDVFVLDDASTDDSPQIARQFSERNANFFVVRINSVYANLKGKMNVLARGLKSLNHDIVLITDADCIVPETWVENMVSYFTPETGMVGGFTSLFPFSDIKPATAKNNLFARIQALDWAFLQAMNALNSHFGKPISILGNNFGFRLKAYREVGGFENIGFSVTEDFALLEAIRKKTSWKIVHTIDKNNAIYSHPLPDLKSFFQQRLRWIQGGRAMRPWGYFVTFFSVTTHFLVFFNWITHFTELIAYLPFILLFLTDFFVLLRPLKRLQLTRLFKDFWAFELFYFAYLFIFSLLGIFPQKIVWKGRKL